MTAEAFEHARGRLFEAIRILLHTLCVSGKPVLLCLEDLHWADSTTLDWLLYLVRQLGRTRILILATYRTEDAYLIDDLRRELVRRRNGMHLMLEGFGYTEIVTLLRYAHISATQDLASHLVQVTGGNPFFLMEIIRALAESDATIARFDPSFLPISVNLREVILHRLRHLSPLAHQILEAGAVWDIPFTFDDLHQVAGRSEVETLDGLDELLKRRVLKEEGDKILFYHDLTRMVVYEGLGGWRRKLLQRRAAVALEVAIRDRRDLESVQMVAQLGYHYAEAGNLERSTEYFQQAGDYASDLYDNRAALVHYERALRILRRLDDPLKVARLLMKIGLAHHHDSNFEQAKQAYEEGSALWQEQVVNQRTTIRAHHALRLDWPNPDTLDPAFVRESNSGGYVYQLFCGLVEPTSGFDIMPELATGWDVSESGRKYVFHIRDDVRWNDGMPLTALDFERAWKRVLDPATGAPGAARLYDIKNARAFHQCELQDSDQVGVVALNTTTLLVELELPVSYFLDLLSECSTFPVPSHILDVYGNAWAKPENIVTCGPFQLESWAPNEKIVLSRSPYYRGYAMSNVDRVELFLANQLSVKALEL